MGKEDPAEPALRQVRWLIAFVIFGLVVSGLTAFPLRWELEILAGLVTAEDGVSPRLAAFPGITEWVLKVRDGLVATYDAYPFIGYGTDWLAFGHVVIALFFVLPWRDPMRYVGVLHVGVWACVLVIPTALICGAVREIPIFWRFIDCAFGIVCLPPLVWAIRQIRKAERAAINR